MISRDGSRYRVEGPVTMSNVRALMEEGVSLFDDAPLEVDLAGIAEADSSAISMLLEWTRRAQGRNQPLHYVNLPENLKSLATVYGVLELIPVKGGGE